MSEKKKGKAPHYGTNRISPGELARYIDQTLLNPYAAEADIIKLCKQSIRYNFYSVCVHPYYVPLCKAILSGYDIKVTTVIGFPLGMSMKNSKVYEAMQAVLYGAQELDVVISIGAVKSGNLDFVGEEISEILSATRPVLLKAIIETCYLDEKEKRAVTERAVSSGAAFIKTSTGFGTKGATVKDVKLIKNIINDRAEVKAAGGIRTLHQVLRFIQAGATRIGTNAGVEIMQEALTS
ncbi:MAG TPA: deoxyribose-phosphate aldolase [Dissulfurispiraceae bacterium]|nr:deoxyribose-phosphate aldolase [Dissulfurispiraceae bacterium]